MIQKKMGCTHVTMNIITGNAGHKEAHGENKKALP